MIDTIDKKSKIKVKIVPIKIFEYSNKDIARLKSQAGIDSIEAISPSIIVSTKEFRSYGVCYKGVDDKGVTRSLMKVAYCDKSSSSEILFIFVDEETRNCGIGSSMIEFAKSGGREVFSMVREDRIDLLKFLSSKGMLAREVSRGKFGELDGIALHYRPEKDAKEA